jgi:molybdopterin/thiamine biosynthesis adenylyltransferase
VNLSWPGPLLLLPKSVAERLDDWGSSWGYLDLRFDEREGLVTIAKFAKKDGAVRLPYTAPWEREHYLRHADAVRNSGVWYRANPEVHDLHRSLFVRRIDIATEVLAGQVPTGWRQPPADSLMLVLTLSQVEADTAWSAWWVSRERAMPGMLDIVDDERTPVDFLRDVWPVKDLADALVTIVGVGSIGSATADALAGYAVGRVALVDDDRLLQHNLIRHRAHPRDLGRFKVNATANRLKAMHPDLEVKPYPLNVIDDADRMRPLFAMSDVVVCATDGIASRRVVNHLARRAGVPLVLACVLEDGALGEIIRIRPNTGCLLCYRSSLVEAGSIDPEPRLDRGYGTGTRHLPMTAAPGDLHLVADLAAKFAVATLLEARGRWNHRLPGDYLVIGLQPVPDLPSPFDLERAGEACWGSLPTPREDCPTCTPP